jgi:hypothetical protein
MLQDMKSNLTMLLAMPRRALGASAAMALLAMTPAMPASSPAATMTRAYDLSWSIHVQQIAHGAHLAKVWIAIPQSLPEQRVTGLSVVSPYGHRLVRDATFHNQVAEIVVPNPPDSFTVSLSARVERAPVGSRPAKLPSNERALYLRKEALVSLSPRIHDLADQIGNTNRDRYEYVLSTMQYDKIVPGWGRGDSERACDVHKGNCTDFHSLFMSLSRAKGVPTLFEMGYPMDPKGEVAQAGGYHCWAWFYDDAAKQWTPVDISEAWKHSEKREFFFGHLDADRVTFSRGRDIVLPGMKGAPLNYLPLSAYVEVDGKPQTEGVNRLLSYSASNLPGAPGS